MIWRKLDTTLPELDSTQDQSQADLVKAAHLVMGHYFERFKKPEIARLGLTGFQERRRAQIKAPGSLT